MQPASVPATSSPAPASNALHQPSIDRLRAQSIAAQQHLIDGRAVPSSDGGRLDCHSPIDGLLLTTLADGTAEDVDRAVASARAAFEDRRWRGLPPAARKKVLHRWADLIEREALALAVLGVRDNGTEIAMALRAEPGSASATIRFYAEALDKVNGEIACTSEDILGLIHREPVGVVAAIVPWNFPLMIAAWKLGPALALGNSVVLKPAETASLSAIRLVELAHEAGLPPGVLNLVTGRGTVVGERLSAHPDVDVLAFTGSGAVGRRILVNAAQSNLKRCYLELGGKSANILFADAPDLPGAIAAASNAIFRNSGQVCVAGSRLLVERSIAAEVIAELKVAAERLRVGDPLDLGNQIGAVNNPQQLARNLDWIGRAQRDGAQLVTGGQQLHAASGGLYMAPALFTDVSPDQPLFQEELFAPVLAVTTFDTEAEAVALANATRYGLAGAVWTRDLGRAHRMIRAVRTGVIQVNSYGAIDITGPMGGVGQSGNGQDKSLHAFDKYLDLKTAWVQL